MKRVSPDKIREHITQGFGRKYYYDYLYRAQSFVYTGKAEGCHVTYPCEDGIPSYPEMDTLDVGDGVSRKILDSGLLTQSRLLSSDPLPVWMDLTSMQAEFRQETFTRRYREQFMHRHTQRSFLDAYFLGVGCTYHGFTTEPISGEQIVDVQQIPAHCLAWDVLSPTPEESPWIAVVFWVSVDEAQAQYPSKIKPEHISPIQSSQDSKTVNAVRLIHYYHKGGEGFEPTFACFAGHIGLAPVAHRSNPWGNQNPFSVMVNQVLPGIPFPVGAAYLEAPSQIITNEMENLMLKRARDGQAMDIINTAHLNPTDFAKWKRKEQRYVRRIQAPKTDEPLFERIPESPIESGILNALQYYEKAQVESGGASSVEHGQPLNLQTAREASLIESQIAAGQGHIARQLALYLTRFVELVCEGMRIGDRAPIIAEWEGDTYEINNPDEPALFLDLIFKTPATVKVDQDALTSQHNVQRKRNKAMDALTLLQVSAGQIPVQPVLEFIMKNLGLEALYEKIEDAQQSQPPMPPTLA